MIFEGATLTVLSLELFPALRDKKKHKAGVLSTGEQQLVALGRALILTVSLFSSSSKTHDDRFSSGATFTY